jgi:hypothetical protein
MHASMVLDVHWLTCAGRAKRAREAGDTPGWLNPKLPQRHAHLLLVVGLLVEHRIYRLLDGHEHVLAHEQRLRRRSGG